MIAVFLFFFAGVCSGCHWKPSDSKPSDSNSQYYSSYGAYHNREVKWHNKWIEILKKSPGSNQEIKEKEDELKCAEKNAIIGIQTQGFGDADINLDRFLDGYAFQVQFKSATLNVFIYKSKITDEGYLHMVGPDNFDLGIKWSMTKDFDGYHLCTKTTRKSMMKILEKIDGVEVKPAEEGRSSTKEWIDGKNTYDNCIPDLHYRLVTDTEFDSTIFGGLGMKLTNKQIEKIENAEHVYLNEKCIYKNLLMIQPGLCQGFQNF